MYVKGNWVAKDSTKGIQLLTSTCDLGSHPACTALGLSYLWAEGVPEDVDKAVDLLGRACETDMKACVTLGDLYFVGRGKLLPANHPTALAYYENPCGAGDGYSCHQIGWLYGVHPAIDGNVKATGYYYEKACELNYMEGCFDLGMMYWNGSSIQRNPGLALSLLDKACNGGLKKACAELESLR